MMKKFITRFAIVFAAIAVLFSSCVKEKVSTYTYACQYVGNVHDETSAQALVDYFNGTCGGYFKESHSYTGVPSETNAMASAEFKEKCESLNEDWIVSQLAAGEQVVICLIEKSSGVTIAYYGWINKEEDDPDEGLV